MDTTNNTENTVITMEETKAALEAAGIRVWDKNGQARLYDPNPRRKGAYATLRAGYTVPGREYCDVDSWGKVSGAFASKVSAVIRALRDGGAQ